MAAQVVSPRQPELGATGAGLGASLPQLPAQRLTPRSNASESPRASNGTGAFTALRAPGRALKPEVSTGNVSEAGSVGSISTKANTANVKLGNACEKLRLLGWVPPAPCSSWYPTPLVTADLDCAVMAAF